MLYNLDIFLLFINQNRGKTSGGKMLPHLYIYRRNSWIAGYRTVIILSKPTWCQSSRSATRTIAPRLWSATYVILPNLIYRMSQSNLGICVRRLVFQIFLRVKLLIIGIPCNPHRYYKWKTLSLKMSNGSFKIPKKSYTNSKFIPIDSIGHF